MNPCFHESIHADFFLVTIFNHYFVDKSIGLYIKLILFETLSVRVVETLLFSGRMIEANNLNVVDGNVISLQLFRLFVSLNLGSLKVMPCTCHCGICSGFWIIFEGITASSTCGGIMELSQKLTFCQFLKISICLISSMYIVIPSGWYCLILVV